MFTLAPQRATAHGEEDNRHVPAEQQRPNAPAAKKPRVHVSAEDVERFGDEEQVRSAWDESRLHDERPPHHD